MELIARTKAIDLCCSCLFYLPDLAGGENVKDSYIQTISNVEDIPPIAADIVTLYCEKNNIDEKDIYPSVWNDIIDELYIQIFNPLHMLLKVDGNRYNQYDTNKVEYVYKHVYKRLCNSHCQEVCQKGFLDMTGINKQTLYDWNNGRLSTQCSDLQQKIMEDNEQSLFALMKDRRNNPMKYLPKLNKVHDWNMPGASRGRDEKKMLSNAELPRLVAEKPQIEVKLQDIVDM